MSYTLKQVDDRISEFVDSHPCQIHLLDYKQREQSFAAWSGVFCEVPCDDYTDRVFSMFYPPAIA